MTPTQQKALQTYRTRQTQRGIARFEIQAPASDRDLIRALARRLASGGPDAAQAWTALERLVIGEPPTTCGILAALRRSPLVGVNLDLTRSRDEGRDPAP